MKEWGDCMIISSYNMIFESDKNIVGRPYFAFNYPSIKKEKKKAAVG